MWIILPSEPPNPIPSALPQHFSASEGALDCQSFFCFRSGLKGEEKEKRPFMDFSLMTSLPSVLFVTNGQKEQRAQ